MKKIFSLFLVAILAFSLCACGSGGGTTSEGASEGGVKVKVGLICVHDENSLYDLNFINCLKESAKKLGFEYVIKTNIPEGQECYEAACELADGGCGIIFADSFGHEDYMIEAAGEYPDVQFCHATGTKAHTQKMANYHNAFAAIHDGRYLTGIVAGMKLNEMIAEGKITEDQAKLGYIGAFTYAEVVSGYSSFFIGARSVCPSATMEVTFAGSWNDETAEKECAAKLIKNGCVVISQHGDSPGAPSACEEAGVPNIAYNCSTKSFCPKTYLTASYINWSPYYEFVVSAVAGGETIPDDFTGTFKNGAVCIAEYGDSIAEGTEAAVEEAKKKLIDGSLHTFDTKSFTVDGKELTSYMADVDTDPNYEGDHEVVHDGFFDESGEEFRSAPYFNLQIDGITMLDTAF